MTSEYLEKTEIAGNTIHINNKENNMEIEADIKLDEDNNNITIPIKISIDDIVKAMLKDGNLINHVVEDSEFDTAVTEILSNNSDDAITDWVSSNGSTIADAVGDYIGTYVSENLDYSDIVSEIKDHLDINEIVDDQIENKLSEYSAGSGCQTAKLAGDAIINTIRYDLLTAMREENGAKSVYDHTIADALTTFIDRRVEYRINKEKEQYLENKQAYMAKPDVESSVEDLKVTVKDVLAFINNLELYQVAKDKIIQEFKATNMNFHQ